MEIILPVLGFGLFFGFVLFVLMILMVRSFYLVRQAEAVIIERLGKYDRILEPGLRFVIPMFERPRSVTWSHARETERGRYTRFTETFSRIDLREAVYDFPKQNVITRDNVTMEINALLYYQITDPKAAIYEVFNLPEAIEQLTQTTLRNVIGHLDLDETLTSRDQINERLRIILDEATDKWGVKVNRVELKEVNPPADIRHAMEKQMRAERDRRAILLEAEGTKGAAILNAEGFAESNILRARGEAESQILRATAEAQAKVLTATAEAQAIEMMKKAIPNEQAVAYMISMGYIKALQEMTDNSDKLVVVPYEANGLAGSLASMKKIFETIK